MNLVGLITNGIVGMEGTISTLGEVTASSSDSLITPTPPTALGVTQTWWRSTGSFVKEMRVRF